MIMDKNGVEIMTGDIVRIDNAYFKVDNGLYFVSDKEGDPTTCGTGLTLHRIRKDGSLSEGKNKIAFWPLIHFCNDREKRAMADDWDSEHATIEVVYGINTSCVADFFLSGAKACEERCNRIRWDWGKHSKDYVLNDKIRKHYLAVADRLEKGVA